VFKISYSYGYWLVFIVIVECGVMGIVIFCDGSWIIGWVMVVCGWVVFLALWFVWGMYYLKVMYNGLKVYNLLIIMYVMVCVY